MEKRDIFVGVHSINFNNRFKTDDDCLAYIAKLKWENGYKCKKCGCVKFISGSKLNNKRCLSCKYDESPTAGTMFDKIKFFILIAFHIIFKIGIKKKGMSTLELRKEFDLRELTCWSFKRK